MTVLVIAENDNQVIKPAVLNTLGAASHLSGDTHLLVAGSNAGSVVEQARKLAGVAKILYADAGHFKNPVAEDLSRLILSLASEYEHILAPATSFGKNLLPRVAALIDVAQISDIVKIEADGTFVRPIYAGNAMAKIKSRDKIKVITVRATAFEPIMDENGVAAVVENLEAVSPSEKAVVSAQELTKSERPELTSASVVVSGGRGMGSGENFDILEKLADKLGAAVGASRAAVDSGYVPNDYQVGQTGKVVAPELYIAVGISGAIQHLAGMKDSKVIVAINKDPDAPIFSVADYGLVADLFEAIPEITESL